MERQAAKYPKKLKDIWGGNQPVAPTHPPTYPSESLGGNQSDSSTFRLCATHPPQWAGVWQGKGLRRQKHENLWIGKEEAELAMMIAIFISPVTMILFRKRLGRQKMRRCGSGDRRRSWLWDLANAVASCNLWPIQLKSATIDKKFATIDKEFATIEKKFATTDKKLATIDMKSEAIDVKIYCNWYKICRVWHEIFINQYKICINL